MRGEVSCLFSLLCPTVFPRLAGRAEIILAPRAALLCDTHDGWPTSRTILYLAAVAQKAQGDTSCSSFCRPSAAVRSEKKGQNG